MKIYVRHMVMVVALIVAVHSRVPAQDATITAEAHPAQIAAGGQFEFVITVSGSDVNNVRPPATPSFGSFVLLSGPNQSTNMQWINGRTSASITFSYVLYAKQAGKFTIPSIAVQHGNKTLSTQPVPVEVLKGDPAAKKPQQSQETDITASIGDNLLLRAVADRQRVRRGEQVTVTYKLYTNIEISQLRHKKDPVAEGFWTEDINTATQLTYGNETLNGKRYRVAVIRQIALFPTQAGTLTVQPFEITCGVLIRRQRRSNDIFDSFFNDPFFQQLQSVDHDVKANALKITVDPLPDSAPDGYAGAVGSYAFNATMDKTVVKAGDPVTLRLIVSGRGNIRLVTMPRPALPGDVEAYEPKLAEDVTRDNGIIKGKKTAEYLLVPRNSGERVIEPMVFSYFDPTKNSYATIRSPRFVLAVEPGKTFAAGEGSVAMKEDVRLLGQDIRFLKLEPGRLERVDRESGWSLDFAAALAFPPLMFLGAYFFRRRQDRLRGDMPRLLFERAGRGASRRLKQAEALLQKGDATAYHAEILRALTKYLEHKLHLPPADFTFEIAVDRLRAGGVSDAACDSLRSCVERAEFARYAPGADSTQARQELLHLASDAITQIERMFSRGAK